jgi:hypothetical protein
MTTTLLHRFPISCQEFKSDVVAEVVNKISLSLIFEVRVVVSRSGASVKRATKNREFGEQVSDARNHGAGYLKNCD